MSYSKICDHFEEISKNSKEGGQILSSILTCFKAFKKSTVQYSQSIWKLTENLETHVLKEGPTSTLSKAISALTEHFKTLAQSYEIFSVSLKEDIISSLSRLSEDLSISCIEEVSKGYFILKSLRKAKKNSVKLKQKYFQASEVAEKTRRKEDSRNEKSIKKAIYSKNKAFRAMEDYKSAIEETNSRWDSYDYTMPKIVKLIERHENNRTEILKTAFEHFISQSADMCLKINSSLIGINPVIKNITPSIDIKFFTDTNNICNPNFREEFVPFEFKYQTEDIKEVAVREEAIIVTKVIDNIYHNKEGDIIDFANVSEFIHDPDGREIFVDTLVARNRGDKIEFNKMMQLVAFTNCLLTAMVMQNEIDTYVFYQTLVISQVLYTEQNNHRRNLSFYLMKHNIWTRKSPWIEAIEFAISAKVKLEKQKIHKKKSSRKKQGAFKQCNSKLEVSDKTDSLIKAATASVISQFNFHMLHMGIPISTATDIVLDVARKASLNKEKTWTLLAELQANQQGKNLALKVPANQYKYKKWGSLLPVKYAVDYLECSDLVSILLVCKKWRSKLKEKIIGRALFLTQRRQSCWGLLLAKEKRNFLGQIDTSNIGYIIEVIEMDVVRSYRKHPLMPSETLKKLLMAYCAYNPTIGYCQGMNYIVGTLYIQFQDEEQTFKSLIGMINKFGMNELYVNKLPKLDQFFYQLDRLIGIFLPEVRIMFREKGISAAHFSSSWFLTIFANVLQDYPELLYTLWDLFIVRGWKIVFRASLVVLDKLSVHIGDSSINDIMVLFNNIGKESVPTIFTTDFLECIGQFHVSNQLLGMLEEEYFGLEIKAGLK